MKLYIANEQFEAKALPPVAYKIKAFLDRRPDGELFSTFKLAAVIGYTLFSVEKVSSYLKGYQHVHRHKKYWAKPATIKFLKQEIKRDERKRR